MKYTQGERVLIQSLDWYNKNKDTLINTASSEFINTSVYYQNLKFLAGQEVTLDIVDETLGLYYVYVFMDGGYTQLAVTESMIESSVPNSTKKCKGCPFEDNDSKNICRCNEFAFGFTDTLGNNSSAAINEDVDWDVDSMSNDPSEAPEDNIEDTSNENLSDCSGFISIRN